MTVTARITPSPEARHLYTAMVACADDDLHLTLNDTLALAIERKRAGRHDGGEIVELLDEQWIAYADDGGWLLGDSNDDTDRTTIQGNAGARLRSGDGSADRLV